MSSIHDRIESWRDKLLDIGNRNPLINCSFSESRGAVEILTDDCDSLWKQLCTDSEAGSTSLRFPWRRDLVPPPEDLDHRDSEDEGDPKAWNPPLEQCQVSPYLTADDLLTRLTDRVLDRRLRNLQSHAKLAISEQGVHAVFAVFGFLKWLEEKSASGKGDVRYSPLVLVPVTLTRASTGASWEILEAEDDAYGNMCLKQRLLQDYQLQLPDLPSIDELEEPGARLEYLQAVREAVKNKKDWEVEDRCFIGRFAFPKIAMWEDLGAHKDEVANHALTRMLADDASVEPELAYGPVEDCPKACDLDDTFRPGEIKTILDCDSSQLEAIAAARRGISFVLDGPPGTGKSQTIANIIGETLGSGRTVLFVSEKSAALDVVKRRLEEKGLGDFCLECHSSKANRKAVLYELEQCLNLPREAYPATDARLDELRTVRENLNNYVRHLHHASTPLGISAFDVFGQISKLQNHGHQGTSSCRLPDATKQSQQTIRAWQTLLEQAIEHESLLNGYEDHPWRDCLLTTRPLSFSEDLRQNAETFAETAAAISQEMQPLVEQRLIEDATLSNASQIIADVSVAATAPAVDPRWLDSPDEFAMTILALSELENKERDLRQTLSEYQEDAHEQYAARQLEFDIAGIQSAQSSLGVTAHPNLRGLSEQLGERVQLLDQLRSLATKVDSSLTEILELTHLPLRPSQPLRAIPHIAKILRKLIAMSPLRLPWFRKEESPEIVFAAEASLRDLKEVTTLLMERSSNWVGDGTASSGLTRGVTAAWKSAREFTDASSTQSLEDLYDKYTSLNSEVRQTRSAVKHFFGLVGANDAGVTVHMATAAANAFTSLQSPELVQSTWWDESVLSRVTKQLPEIIEELTEATSLRDDLSDRLSHRAFRPESDAVVKDAERFASVLGRLGKRYAQFKVSVADLYRSELPGREQILADCKRLATYHKRSSMARELAAELEPFLPDGYDIASLDAMKRIHQAAVSVTEALHGYSSAVVQPRQPVVDFDAYAVADAARDVLLAIERQSEIPGEIAEKPLGAVEATVMQRCEAIANCLSFLHSAGVFYNGEMPPVEIVVSDVQITERVESLKAAIRTRADELEGALPEVFDESNSDDWQDLTKRVEQASAITSAIKMTGAAACKLCSVESSVFHVAGQKLNVLLSSHDELLNLLKSKATVIEEFADQPAEKLVAASIETTTSNLVEEIAIGAATAASHVSLLKAGCDIAVEDLPAASQQLRSLHDICQLKLRQRSSADRLGLAAVHPDDVQKARWLQDLHFSDRLTPLVRSAATETDVRSAAQNSHTAFQRIDELNGAANYFNALFSPERPIEGEQRFRDAPLMTASRWVQSLNAAAGDVDGYLRFERWRKELTSHRLEGVANELIEQRYMPEASAAIVMLRIYRSIGDHLISSDSVLRGFDLESHERLRQEFESLDRWEIQAAATAIREFQLGRSDRSGVGFEAAANSELGVLQKELSKKRKHMPLRRLFSEIAEILLKLKPCVMMSPLSVSTFLTDERLRFDLVVFDEASQVFPWDAMGAIYRGSQLIVAGDEKQLPPTSFFERAESESEDDDDIADYESILSVCKANNMPAIRLRWHYRSRREALIAFSNRHFYNGDLVTFPSSRDASDDGVRLELVEDGLWLDQKNLPEAKRVVDLVIEHFRVRPGKSLGVIAFSQSQRAAIDDELYDRRRKNPIIDKLVGNSGDEPLFIKNLERVQGDERDVIVLSIGYARNADGKIPARFGPINKSGGERRLNVAVTRAREQMVVVSSIRAADVDLSGSKSEGAHLLKAYLAYAETGTDSLGVLSSSIGDETESPFEADVAAALIRRGFEPVPQVGCGGFRIDLALKHPDRPGEFCLGIECDGATYHSSSTARDRDRIRQSMLEALGWKIVRVWSTDWVRDPERQLQRIELAYQDALVEAEEPALEEITPEQIAPEASKPLEATLHFANETKTSVIFDNINDVPESTIEDIVARILQRTGPCAKEDLIRTVSRELGFRRLGQRIRERLSSSVAVLLHDEKLRDVGGRLAFNDR